MDDLIQSPSNIAELRKKIKKIRANIQELYLLKKQDEILRYLEQSKVELEEIEQCCNELEINAKKILYGIDSHLFPKKLSKEFKEISLPIIEIVNNAILDKNKHGIKKMFIIILSKIDEIYVMCNYGKGYDSTIVHNQTFSDSFDKVSKYGLLVTKISPTDFGLKNNIEVTLIIY